jgi:hypothetical protein
MRTQAIYKLLNMVPSKKQLLILDEEAKWANVYQLSLLIDSFFEHQDGKMIIQQDYVHNPVPAFKPLWRTYHGPADGFRNVTFGEYTDGLRLFLQYSATGNENLLHLLASIFYRKAKPLHAFKKRLPNYDGDIRQAYNSNLIEDRANVFRYAPKGFIYGFYMYFASFQKYITGAQVPWGGKMLDLSILFDPGESETQEAVPGLGMDSLSFALAESGEFGNLEAVRKTNVWEIFIRLYDLKKKDLDYKLNDKSKSK